MKTPILARSTILSCVCVGISKMILVARATSLQFAEWATALSPRLFLNDESCRLPLASRHAGVDARSRRWEDFGGEQEIARRRLRADRGSVGPSRQAGHHRSFPESSVDHSVVGGLSGPQGRAVETVGRRPIDGRHPGAV